MSGALIEHISKPGSLKYDTRTGRKDRSAWLHATACHFGLQIGKTEPISPNDVADVNPGSTLGLFRGSAIVMKSEILRNMSRSKWHTIVSGMPAPILKHARSLAAPDDEGAGDSLVGRVV
jgi:hypothetical protein